MRDPQESDLVLVEPQRRQYVILAIDMIFVIAGAAILATGGLALGLTAMIFFGVGLVLAVRSIIRPPQLVLRSDGFRFVSLGRPSPLFEWQLSRGFHPWSPTVGATFIAFEYDGPKPVYRGRLARINRMLAGGNCCLPSTYGMRARDLCQLLETRRQPLERPPGDVM